MDARTPRTVRVLCKSVGADRVRSTVLLLWKEERAASQQPSTQFPNAAHHLMEVSLHRIGGISPQN